MKQPLIRQLLLSSLILLFSVSSTFARHERTNGRMHSQHHLQKSTTSKDRKFISVVASLTGDIFLHCPIQFGEDVQVSWVRLPDWRIVASGRKTYSNDGRYRVLHIDGTNEWSFQIKYASLEDQGLYECQVSTGTGIVTHHYNVSVSIPTTSIFGGSEYHVDKGSAIQLTCIIHNVSQEPQFVFWYHNERMINYDADDKERVQVLTLSSSSSSLLSAAIAAAVAGSETFKENVGTDHVFSHLTIRNVTDADSGNYSCVPSNAEPTSTMVYVSEGDEAAAAIQVGVEDSDNGSSDVSTVQAPSSSSTRWSCPSPALIIVIGCYWNRWMSLSR